VDSHGDPRTTPREAVARLPMAPGVYRFRDAAGQVLYLGRAVSLRRRVASYWGDLGGRRHLSLMVARIAGIEAVACDSAHEAAWLERNLLRESLPPWNRSRDGGQESEVWILVTESARAPGLRVVHRPARAGRHFGPYLGGSAARLAVSGLCRVFPLGYTADGPGGGTRLEMARALGVSAGERATLSAAVAAVLDRDRGAVAAARAGLAARREAAAGALSFEFAARLQAEIEALDWITAEQKVTQPSPASFDAHGWTEGTLVTFTIRGGRLTAWAQRPGDAASARRLLAATPPAWQGFAQRNAELAARLAR
jgi:excinuclease ABC subunit C